MAVADELEQSRAALRMINPAPFNAEAPPEGLAVELAVTLECAGNGRLEMRPLPVGEPWGDYAVSTALWKGALLHEVLERAHPAADGIEVQFTGADHGAYLPQPVLPETNKNDLTF